MGQTTNYNLPYPSDYTAIADVPEAIKDLAEATDTALESKADTSDIPSLTDYVKNTDYATTSTGGVVKVSASLGTSMRATGVIQSSVRTYAEYTSSENTTFISKGTLENVLNARIGDIETLLYNINRGSGV